MQVSRITQNQMPLQELHSTEQMEHLTMHDDFIVLNTSDENGIDLVLEEHTGLEQTYYLLHKSTPEKICLE